MENDAPRARNMRRFDRFVERKQNGFGHRLGIADRRQTTEASAGEDFRWSKWAVRADRLHAAGERFGEHVAETLEPRRQGKRCGSPDKWQRALDEARHIEPVGDAKRGREQRQFRPQRPLAENDEAEVTHARRLRKCADQRREVLRRDQPANRYQDAAAPIEPGMSDGRG
jgi:hypothetical protein